MVKHSGEFKREAACITLTSGLLRERFASDLGITHFTLGKPLARYRPTHLTSAPQGNLALDKERLRPESRMIKDERVI